MAYTCVIMFMHHSCFRQQTVDIVGVGAGVFLTKKMGFQFLPLIYGGGGEQLGSNFLEEVWVP